MISSLDGVPIDASRDHASTDAAAFCNKYGTETTRPIGVMQTLSYLLSDALNWQAKLVASEQISPLP